MLIAVTGATGFLGRYIVNEQLRRGDTCRCWYRSESDRGGFLEAGNRLQWIEGQLGDAGSNARLVEGADAVVHAALPRAGNVGDAFPEFIRLNVMGSLELMHAAHRAGVGRFVFISTCAVHEKILDDRPLDEAHPLWPSGHYGAYKAAVEKFVHSFGLGEKWPACALRPTGIHGMRRPVQRSRWFGLVQQVIKGEPIDSQWGGKQVHAADCARAVAALLTAPADRLTGEAFNCYGQYVTEEHIAAIAKAITGSASRITEYGKRPQHEIDTRKIQALGVRFGGDASLEAYVRQLVEAARS